jgi:hypothetical protein
MSALLLTDLKEGDIIVVKDSRGGGRLARVEKLTREGKLLVSRRWNACQKWGVTLEVTLDEVIKVEERV